MYLRETRRKSKVKSLDFVTERIKSGSTGLTDIKFDQITELYFRDMFKTIFEQEFPEDNKVMIESDNKLIAEVIYDPNADFNYFSMTRCIHDGTLSFVIQLIEELLTKVFGCKTYNQEVLPNAQDFDIFIQTHYIKYTIGDIVLGVEHDGDFIFEDKEWMHERTTAMLPIKFEVIEKIEGDK